MRQFQQFALLFLLGGNMVFAQVTKSILLNFDGMMRSYLLRLPKAYDSIKPLPLIVDLHGYTNPAAGQSQLSGFKWRVDIDTFLVAWPQGDSNSWNAGIGCCGRAERENRDDVGFIKAVVKHIREAYVIDGHRVYATGHSNGGAMAQRLAAEAGDVFAAVAGFSGMLLVPAKPARPIPILNFHGYEDSVVPYAGKSIYPGADSTLRIWAKVNHCEGEPDTVVLSAPSQCLTYSHCQDSVSTGLCSVGGDHMIYNNTPRIDLSILAWKFFSQFTLKNPPEVTATQPSPSRRKKPVVKTRTPTSLQRYLGRTPE